MNFSDIDFSKISQMMNSMSPEEKERLNNMAQDMMSNFQKNQEAEVEEEIDMYQYLQMDEEDYVDMLGISLDQIEAAVDLEQYYEDVSDADFSASLLFYSKAVLNCLRKYHYPIYKNVLEIPNFNNALTTTIYSYLYPLMQLENIHKLVDEGFSTSENWIEHKNLLQQVYVLLNRAEYDSVSYEELQVLKNMLFEEKGLLRIKEMI